MRNPILFLTACLLAAPAVSQDSSNLATASAKDQADVAAIQQLEKDWLKTERTTALERILADDFAGIGPNGPTPGKAELLKVFQAHAGQAPPYKVEQSDMQIIVRGDTAVAAYTKTYTAKENGNLDHEFMTDVFTRDDGRWQLRISHATSCHH